MSSWRQSAGAEGQTLGLLLWVGGWGVDLGACLRAFLSSRRAVFDMLGARLNTNRNAVGPENPVSAGVLATLSHETNTERAPS